MVEHTFGNLVYTYDAAAGEALGKRESHTPRIDAPAKVKPDEPFDLKVTVGPHPNMVEHSVRWIMVTLEEEGRAFNPVVLAKGVLDTGDFPAGGYSQGETAKRRRSSCCRVLQPPWALGREKDRSRSSNSPVFQIDSGKRRK